MDHSIDYAVRLIRAGVRAYEKKWAFLGMFALGFLGSAGTLAHFNLLPEMLAAEAAAVTEVPNVTLGASAPKAIEAIEFPTKIDIPAIGLSASIANPTTVNIEVLDEKLLAGAVRYPTSASLGEVGNVVLFGHSSYLPVVGNQAYKTFNGIQKLVAGDIVVVSSLDTSYTYRVRSVAKESANDNSGIPLSVVGKVLTLVTCDSFGAKSDRFVIVADFVESHSISN